MKKKLTKKSVDALIPAENVYDAWDPEIGGFHVRVRPNGRKTFRLHYRTTDGVRRNPVLGEYGEITADQARDAARKMMATVTLGGDPSGDRKERRKILTVKELAEEYLRHAATRKRASSLERDRYSLKHILPALGSKKIAAVTTREVQKLHARMGATPVNANRTLALLSRMFTLAERWGFHAGENPCRKVEQYPEQGRKRYLSADEFARLGIAMAAAEDIRDQAGDGPFAAISRPALDCIRLIAMTGCRRGEIMNLRWRDVDFERGVFHLKETKTVAREVYLSKAAILTVGEIRARQHESGTKTDFVCPSPRDPAKPIRELKTAWRSLCKAAEIGEATVHDLRHSYASTAINSGIPLAMIGGMLGHAQARTTERYAHLADDPLRRAAELTGASVASLMSGGAKIVEIGKPDAAAETPAGSSR